MSLKILINNEEVVCNNNIQIKEEMLSTSSTILKNCYPKVWENDKDYVSRYYYPKDYSKCKIYNLPRENTTQEQTGTNLSFETYVGKSTIEDIKFYGDTIQDGTPTPDAPVEIQNVTGLQNINVCGKNLFDKSTITTGKYIDASGNLVNNNSNFVGNYIPIDNTKSYYASQSLGGVIRVGYYDSNKAFISRQLILANYGSLTIPNNAVYVRLSCYNQSLDTLQLEQNSTATTYEPYTGNTYEVNLGKNLFDKNNITTGKRLYYWQGEVSLIGDTNYCVSDYINVNANSTYTINLTMSAYTRMIFFDNNKSPLSANETNATFTTPNNTAYVRLSVPLNQLDTTQLEKGTQSTSYSPYFTPIELNKIGDYEDRIYKDSGKWYLEKNIGKVVLDGSEANWSKSGNTTFDRFILGAYNINGIVAQGGYSNYFEVATINVANNLYEMSNNGNSQLVFNYSTYGTTDLTTFKTWLSTHNIVLYYALATPTYTEITNEELINQLESLNIELYEGQTNFIINGSLPMPTYIKIYNNFEDLIFCGFTKNTGNVSLNPRQFHGVDLQILDFKDLLSTGETLNYVIANKTITEAINQVINSISDYGFVVGNIQLLNPNEMIGAYSTLNKTAYDVFQYFADITQSRWTTRMIDENTIAIDFYDPTLMPTASPIQSTQAYYENNKIIDISFNYSTNDYRNKQIMTSDEVYGNITQTETIIADGYNKNFTCQNKIGTIESITLNGVSQTFITKSEEELGLTADFIYQPGEMQFSSSTTISSGGAIVISYYPIVKGREIILNSSESIRISTQIGRKGTISRYENRNDTTSSAELQKIGQSYIKYKGQAEITLKVISEKNLFNVGQIVEYQAPLEELATDYMVKSKTIDWYVNADKIFYTYELTSNFNYENAINYFDNQRAKNQGNIGEGQVISRNIDLESTALILFYDTDIEEIEVQNPTSLDFALDGVII